MAAPKKGAVPKAQGIRYRTRKDGSVRGYEVRYRDPSTLDGDGQPVVRGRTFRTLDEAKAFQRDNAHSIQRGTYISPDKQRVTWGEVSQQWITARRVKLRPRTIIGYENMLGRWHSRWNQIAIGDLTPEHVRRLLSDVRAAGLAEETEHRIFNVASGVFKFAAKNHLIHEAPTHVVRDELRSVRGKTFHAQPPTREQAEAIIGRISPGRNRMFALLLLWTRMRGGELAGLRVRNVDRLRNVVQVEDTIQDLKGTLSVGTTKTFKSKGRRIPVPRAVMQQVGDYIDTQRKQPNDFLFSAHSDHFHYQNWSKRHWAPACRKAGLTNATTTRTGRQREKPVFRPYDLRHARLSMWAAEGIPAARSEGVGRAHQHHDHDERLRPRLRGRRSLGGDHRTAVRRHPGLRARQPPWRGGAPTARHSVTSDPS